MQLAILFRRRIETGVWTLGERIPTVDELAIACDAARETVRQALDILENEGLIRRYRAKGTFVTKAPRQQLWCELQTNFFGLLQAREGAKVEVLNEASGVQLSGPLDFGTAAASYRRLQRLFWRENEPYMVSDLFILEALIDKIPRADLTSKPALKIITDVPGLEIGDVEQIMTVGSADMEAAAILKLPLNAPVANVDRYVVDKDGVLVLCARNIYRGDVVRLSIKFK